MSIEFEALSRINNLTQAIEIITGGSYTDLTEAVQALKNGYNTGGGIVPSGTKEITENGEHDISEFAIANVDVSNLTKYRSGYITFSNFITGAYTSYDNNPIIIDIVDFSPKIFIFRPENYTIGKTLCKYSTSYHIILSSICMYSGLIKGVTSDNRMGHSFTNFITKTTASGSGISGAESTISVSSTGFRKKDADSTEVYWYCNQTGYTIRNGTWFWEAYA